MSGSGMASNSYLHGGTDGNPIGVTPGGNVGTSTIYDNIKNVGRVNLRTTAPYQLPDCPASWVTIYSSSNNGGNIWIGGITVHSPQQGVGYPLVVGAQITLPCTNSNQISLLPSVDGDIVYIVIGAVGNTVPITPGSPPPLDKAPPTIISTSPLNGTASIPINASISVLASEALDPSSINSTNVTIGPAIAGFNPVQDSSNPANIVLLYTPNLATSTLYTINVANITDLTGNNLATPYSFNFTTGTSTAADTTPPTVTSTTPANNATNFAIGTSPTITFSEAILPGSVTTASISIINVTAGNTNVTGFTLSQSSDRKTVTIGSLSLANSTQYKIIISNNSSSGIKDLAGNPLDQTYNILFTTQAPSVVLYNVAGTGSTYSSMNITNFYQVCSIYVNTSTSQLIGKVPVACSLIMKKVGNPPDKVIVQLDQLVQVNGSDTQQFIKGIGTITANSLGTSDTTVSFSMPTNTTAFTTRMALSVWYQSGDANNYVMIKCSSADAFDGSNTCLLRYLYNGTVGTVGTSDLAGTISVAA
jgi:hypothetical protein